MNASTSIGTLTAASATIFLSACGWVDSTGVQPRTVATQLPSAYVSLANYQPVALLEEQTVAATLTGEGAGLANWSWSETEGDARAKCTGIVGFDARLAATDLANACTHAGECRIAFGEQAGETDTQLTIRMPTLSIPVALNYALNSVDDEGVVVQRQQVLCGLSINEAPLANDDNYLALYDETRVVTAEDPDHLLANDQDDVDGRNLALRVSTEPVQAPLHAAQFALTADGGFIYQASEDIPFSDSGVLEDTFVYAVTDGLHTVNATAIIKIVDSNRTPRRLRRLPDIEVQANVAGSADNREQFDLSRYFFDPDGDPLKFKIENHQLPPGGNIQLDPGGLLVVNATDEDIGSWYLEVTATDGLNSISDNFLLEILGSQADSQPNDQSEPTAANSSPTVTDIRNRIVKDDFVVDVSEYFHDDDGDLLEFTAAGLPDGVYISRRGVITGYADSDNTGSWYIRVTASDGNGGSVSDAFLLVIRQ